MSDQTMAAAPQPTVGILPEEADLHTAEARVNKHKADWRGWKFMWPFASKRIKNGQRLNLFLSQINLIA